MPAFRRRPFRRIRRPGFARRGRPIRPAARRAVQGLKRAHFLMSQGQSAEAAAIFQDLAQRAERHQMPRSAHLFLQAGWALIVSSETDRGMDLLRRGMRGIFSLGQPERATAAARRILTGLRQRGLTAEAASFETEVKEMFPSVDLTPRAPSALPHLPAKCPYCGGSVRSDEVEWIDDMTAVCDYCSSTLEKET